MKYRLESKGQLSISSGCVFLLSLMFLALATKPSPAQSGRHPDPIPGQTDKPIARIETREVLLPLSAYDLDGHSVGDLKPEDLLVIEDGLPRAITELRREPANIVLILDLGNEIGTFKNGPSSVYHDPERQIPDLDTPMWKKPFQILPRPAAREFADNVVNGLAPADQLAIIAYSDRLQLIQDWTGSQNDAIESLRSKYRIGLQARYYDALLLAARKLEQRASGRRVVVIISDGLDNGSKARREEALAALTRARAAVFVVGWSEVLKREVKSAIDWTGAHEVYSTSTIDRVRELKQYLPQLEGGAIELRNLDEGSGGDMWLPETYNAIVSAPRTVLQEVGEQYTLAFSTDRSASLDPLRTVQVLPARRGLSIRARKTYYIEEESRN
jgi:VWFA-related protein